MITHRLLMGGGGSFTIPFVAAGNLVTLGSVVTVDSGAGYKAFPGLCWTPNNRLMLVYRHGSEHDTPDDGYIARRYSDDGGLTWGAAVDIYNPADDVRDPSLTVLSDGRIAMSVFRFASNIAYQCEVLFSSDNGATWGTPVVVGKFYPTDAHTYEEAACAAPLVEITPTDYLLPVYMKDIAASNWNAFAMPSDDSGATFDDAILIATGGGSWVEPWITPLPDGDLLCLVRKDNADDAFQTISTDDGATWPAPAFAWDGDSRNATIFTNSGALFTIGRNGGVQGQYGTSWDQGASWETRANLPAPSSNFMYAAAAQVAPRRIVVVWSQETSSTDADLYAQAFDDTGP
jgi:hypothetical protein